MILRPGDLLLAKLAFNSPRQDLYSNAFDQLMGSLPGSLGAKAQELKNMPSELYGGAKDSILNKSKTNEVKTEEALTKSLKALAEKANKEDKTRSKAVHSGSKRQRDGLDFFMDDEESLPDGPVSFIPPSFLI